MNSPRDPAVQELLDREAIRGCIHRCCRGIDRVDEAALRSAYWPDADCRHGALRGTGAEFIDVTLPRLQAGGRTVHLIGNILIELHGDVAAAESYFRTTLAGHDDHGAPRETLLLGRYLDRFERRGTEWRIAARTVAYDWIRHTALDGAVVPEVFGSRQPVGERWPADPLYDLLAQMPAASRPDRPCAR